VTTKIPSTIDAAALCKMAEQETRDVTNPRDYIVTDTLKDGTTVTIRGIRRDDSAKVVEAFTNLDRESIYTRFFTYKRHLSETELRQVTDVDFNHVVALVVTTRTENGETIIAEGRYVTDDAPRPCRTAEVAFTTEENYQGRGIARLLLQHLVRIARENGVSRFEASVLAGNQPMVTVFRRSGLPIQQRSEDGVLYVTLLLPAEDSGGPSR
jgi:GNAT superfamily N-acetyltransferase